MFLFRRKYFLYKIILLIFIFLFQKQENDLIGNVECIRSSDVLSNKIFKLLTQIEGELDGMDSNSMSKSVPYLNRDFTFALHLSEFLIKQKVRFYESTRYEEQQLYKILQKLNSLIAKSEQQCCQKAKDSQFFRNIFKKNILLSQPMLKSRTIVKNLDYHSLVQMYDSLVDKGSPDFKMSDDCLYEIAFLHSPNCSLNNGCLDVITSDLPTYGYHRLHQLLLLFVLMHHQCSMNWGSSLAYEILASGKCSEVFREQNLIRSLGIPIKYQDLFLEQNVICGLFGYSDFLNIPNLNILLSWKNIDGCYCLAGSPLDEKASNHQNLSQTSHSRTPIQQNYQMQDELEHQHHHRHQQMEKQDENQKEDQGYQQQHYQQQHQHQHQLQKRVQCQDQQCSPEVEQNRLYRDESQRELEENHLDCSCTNHINGLALVYYINALLMLT